MNGNRILRYPFIERLVHAVSGVAYVYLLLTGLAFWTPALYWLASMLGGAYLSRLLHPWIGLLFALTLIPMFALWWRDMRVTPEDKAWQKEIGHYIRNEDDKVPPVWRFNYGQKQWFWLIMGGGVALLISGVLLWVTASIPWEWRLLRYAAILIHAVAALATIGGFIIHIYMGVAVVPGGLDAIIHGEVTEEWARRHHPLWLARLREGALPEAGRTDAARRG